MPLKTQSAIDAQGVAFRFNGEPVLTDVTFSLATGSYTGIIGPNGSGKTTLLRIILGLMKPESGTVRVFGASPEAARASGTIGYVPQRITQNDAHFPATVEEIVRSGRIARLGIGARFSPEDRAAVQHALRLTDVSDIAGKRIQELSGGQKQRVFIARALAADPRLLLLDEPVTGVDQKAKEQFYGLLRRLNTEHGMTIVFVSHDIDVMVNEASWIICLNQRIHCQSTPEEFLHSNALRELYGSDMHAIPHYH